MPAAAKTTPTIPFSSALDRHAVQIERRISSLINAFSGLNWTGFSPLHPDCVATDRQDDITLKEALMQRFARAGKRPPDDHRE